MGSDEKRGQLKRKLTEMVDQKQAKKIATSRRGLPKGSKRAVVDPNKVSFGRAANESRAWLLEYRAGRWVNGKVGCRR